MQADEIMLNHTFNEQQIERFKAGSALNRMKQAASKQSSNNSSSSFFRGIYNSIRDFVNKYVLS
jgi:hypothetical protein